jgi:hypothetical protein
MRSTYTGFVGLNTGIDDFSDYVMQFVELSEIFANGTQFDACYAYPKTVAQGFNEPPVFSALEIYEYAMKIQADIHTNQQAGCIPFFARLALPERYRARDHLLFSQHPDAAFGAGTCYVTTVDCLLPDDTKAVSAEKKIAVAYRPALFLKVPVGGLANTFYPNMLIFFPDRVSGLSHLPVRNGEAFALVRHGYALTDAMLADLNATFNALVNTKKYKWGNELYSTTTKLPLAQELVDDELLRARNKLD